MHSNDLLLLLLCKTISEMFLEAFWSCDVNRICSKSYFFFIIGTGRSLCIDLALVMSLYNVVAIVSRSLPLNPFSDLLKQNFITFTRVSHPMNITFDQTTAIYRSGYLLKLVVLRIFYTSFNWKSLQGLTPKASSTKDILQRNMCLS